jgi:tetratricopeptide (TPR) repeat protein
MVENPGKNKVPEGPKIKDVAAKSTPAGEDFQTKALDEIRKLSVDEKMGLVSKAINEAIEARGSTKALPLSGQNVDSNNRANQNRSKTNSDELLSEDEVNKRNHELKIRNSVEYRIRDALSSSKAKIIPSASKEEIAHAKNVLMKAGVASPSIKLLNAVILAEGDINRPGCKIEAINDGGRLRATSEFADKDLEGKMKFGGETSKEYVHTLYTIARAFMAMGQNDMAAYYSKHGIEITKLAYPHSADRRADGSPDQGRALLAMFHVRAGISESIVGYRSLTKNRHSLTGEQHVADNESAEKHFQEAFNIYNNLYSQPGMRNPELLRGIVRCCSEGLLNAGYVADNVHDQRKAQEYAQKRSAWRDLMQRFEKAAEKLPKGQPDVYYYW